MGVVSVNHMISLNEKKVKVITYFMFESTRNYYLIYCEPKNRTTIYLGQVIEKKGKLYIHSIDKASSFVMKKFIKELTEENLDTVMGYRYANKLSELKDDFIYQASQKIVLGKEQKKALEEFVEQINQHNKIILEKATKEYYIQLADQKIKDRKTIFILLGVIIFIILVIVKMIVDFI